MHKLRNHGFTIVELLIATVVFSVILVVCTTGLIQIGRMYHRGIIASRTQESARAVVDNISQAIQFNGDEPIVLASTDGGRNRGFCVGDKLYSARVTGKDELDLAHALVLEEVPNCNGGTPIRNMNTSVVSPARDMLGDDMRVVDMTITPSGNLTTITLVVAYGTDNLDPDADGQLSCPALSIGGQFCAISSLSTTVQKRI